MTFQPAFDFERLTRLLDRVRAFMQRGEWVTLRDIQQACGGSEASCSARLRDLRRPEHGRHVIARRHRGDPKAGLYEYRLVP
jgi:hypothetical protein